MLLHNQCNRSLQWEAGGDKYEWEPFGSCEVHEKWVPHLRDQGFPVDVAPVPVPIRAQGAADEERAAREKSDLVQMQKRLADAEARVAESTKIVEAAQAREARATANFEQAEAQLRKLSSDNEQLRSDAEAYEKMLTEATAKIEQLEERSQKSHDKKQSQHNKR